MNETAIRMLTTYLSGPKPKIYGKQTDFKGGKLHMLVLCAYEDRIVDISLYVANLYKYRISQYGMVIMDAGTIQTIAERLHHTLGGAEIDHERL